MTKPNLTAEITDTSNVARALAQAVHSVIRAIDISNGDRPQPCWDELSFERQGELAGAVVKSLIGPGKLPEEVHDEWRASKAADGWTYGEDSDEEAKTSPLMVPWADMTERVRRKSFVLPALIAIMRGERYFA